MVSVLSLFPRDAQIHSRSPFSFNALENKTFQVSLAFHLPVKFPPEFSPLSSQLIELDRHVHHEFKSIRFTSPVPGRLCAITAFVDISVCPVFGPPPKPQTSTHQTSSPYESPEARLVASRHTWCARTQLPATCRLQKQHCNEEVTSVNVYGQSARCPFQSGKRKTVMMLQLHTYINKLFHSFNKGNWSSRWSGTWQSNIFSVAFLSHLSKRIRSYRDSTENQCIPSSCLSTSICISLRLST